MPREKQNKRKNFLFSRNGCPRPQKGCQSFADRIGAVFPCFLCFWKPPQLTTKAFVLLNTLPHILHEVCGLAVQHITNLFQSIHGQMLHRASADSRHRGRMPVRSASSFWVMPRTASMTLTLNFIIVLPSFLLVIVSRIS